MVQFLEDVKGTGAPPLTPAERIELESLRKQAVELRNKVASLNAKSKSAASDSSDSEGDVVAELPKVVANPLVKPKGRTSVSAEAFGKYHAKELYTVKEVAKSEETKMR